VVFLYGGEKGATIVDGTGVGGGFGGFAVGVLWGCGGEGNGDECESLILEEIMRDFPAAHSMDTDWFAVDANGNIAVFDSSEGGAVPCSNREMITKHKVMFLDDFFPYLPHDEQGTILLKTPATEWVQGVTLNQLQKEIKIAKKSDLKWLRNRLFDLLLIFSEASSIQKLNTDNPVFRLAGEPIVFWYRQVPIKDLESLIASQEIIGGKSISLYQNRHLLGLFSYDHPIGHAHPYDRNPTPTIPWKLEDLPEPIQDSISWTWFDDLRFSEAEKIQPLEHTKCDTWGISEYWVDTQGQEHEEYPN
jgi:hypothetical protein